MWPTQEEPFLNTAPQWEDVFVRRVESHAGFIKIETRRGDYVPHGLDTPQGQNWLRLQMFKVLEELQESRMSTDPDHAKEELIDAFNYLLSLLLIDRSATPISREVLEIFQRTADHIFFNEGLAQPPFFQKFSDAAMLLSTSTFTGELSDSLRSRSWMENDQDSFFRGGVLLLNAVIVVAFEIMQCFKSFDEFIRFYNAKDNVLKFRLETKY